MTSNIITPELATKLRAVRQHSTINPNENDASKKLHSFMSHLKDNEKNHDQKFRTGKYKGKTFDEVFESDKLYLKWLSTKADPNGLMLGDQRALISYLVNKELSKHEGGELEKYRDLSDAELIECLIPHEEKVKKLDEYVGKIKFKFGKHKGKSIEEVYKEDSSYLQFLLKKNKYDVEEYMADPVNFKVTNENWMTHKIIVFISSLE